MCIAEAFKINHAALSGNALFSVWCYDVRCKGTTNMKKLDLPDRNWKHVSEHYAILFVIRSFDSDL